jgi:hypothetical protein
MPRKTDVPGYSTSNPDLADFAEAARALKVSPFYEGPDSVPFSRMRATQVLDPTSKRSLNDFYLA